MTANQLPKPTPEQAAILRSKKQCKIVVAVPGAGKTTMLLQAIQQHCLSKHTKCLFISFSRKSTAENVEKIQLYFPNHIHQITVSTFDSFCYRVLHDNWELAGYAKEPFFDRSFDPELFTQAYEAVARKTSNFISMEMAESIIRTSIFKHYSIKKAVAKESTVGLTDYLKALRSIKRRYIKLRKNNGAIHFSEQVSECSKLLRAQPELITDIVAQYKLILIDELQDLTAIQMNIVMLLAQAAHKTILVGDDAQSVYSFRGADGNNFYRLENALSVERGKPIYETFSLSETHRCTQPIALLATAIRNNIEGVTAITMHSNKEGDKPKLVIFSSEYSQYEYVAKRIIKLNNQGIKLSEICIISRLHESCAQMQRMLQQYNINLNTKYTVDTTILADEECEYCIENLLDIVVALINLLDNGYNQQVLQDVFNYLHIEATTDNYSYIEKEFTRLKTKDAIKIPNKALEGIGRMLHKAANQKSLEAKTKCITEFVINKYRKHTKYYIAAHFTAVNILSRTATTFSEIIASIKSMPIFNEESVSLLTTHASKGLEFKVVFVIDANNRMFPYHHSSKSLCIPNDELKFFYVAITRASELLTICSLNMKRERPTEFVTNLKGKSKLLTVIDKS